VPGDHEEDDERHEGYDRPSPAMTAYLESVRDPESEKVHQKERRECRPEHKGRRDHPEYCGGEHRDGSGPQREQGCPASRHEQGPKENGLLESNGVEGGQEGIHRDVALRRAETANDFEAQLMEADKVPKKKKKQDRKLIDDDDMDQTLGINPSSPPTNGHAVMSLIPSSSSAGEYFWISF